MNRNKTTTTTHGIALSVLAIAMATALTPARADDQTASTVDTSKFKCKYCLFEEGYSGDVELGGGYVSDDSYKFGEYTGLNKQGGFLVGNATARYRSLDARYLDLSVTDLGLDSRSLGVAGGKQGSYRLFLKYDELPHYISNTAVTPFLGTGSGSLTLPSTWTPGGTTGSMSSLANSLHGVNLETQRKRLDLGASLMPTTHWEYAVKFRHETKDGQLGTAGTFIFNAAQLIQPVDYTTDQVDASATYSGKNLQAVLAYYGSTFKNGDAALTWENPYTPTLGGATSGQLALPPSNQFHQFVLSAGYQFNPRTRAMGDVAIGRMTQNEDFLPVTTNLSLGAPALSRDSLDGKVDTLTAHAKLVSSVTDKLRLNAAYTYDDRNNKTPQTAYDWVRTDSTLQAPRINQPYSFTHNLLNLSADYRLPQQAKLGAGFDYETYHRSLQDIDKTKEGTLWGKVSARAGEYVDLMLKAARANRNVSAFQANPEIQTPENPLMRKYNMADRTRNTIGLHSDITPQERITFGIGADYAWDDYSNSVVGLLDDRESDLSGDVAVMLSDKTSVNAYLNRQQIKSNQDGSSTYAAPDWFAKNVDTTDTAGIGVKHSPNVKLDLGADYTLSRSTGRITVSGASIPFPDLVTRLDSLKLYATYRLKPAVSLHGAYWYERYDTADWAVDGVLPSTIPNVLSLGQGSPSYHVNVVTFSVRYKF